MLTKSIIDALKANARFNQLLFSIIGSENGLPLFEILLEKGRLHEEWRTNHLNSVKYSSLHKQILINEIEIIFDFLNAELRNFSPACDKLAEKMKAPISLSGFPSATIEDVIDFHSARESIHNDFKTALKQIITNQSVDRFMDNFKSELKHIRANQNKDALIDAFTTELKQIKKNQGKDKLIDNFKNELKQIEINQKRDALVSNFKISLKQTKIGQNTDELVKNFISELKKIEESQVDDKLIKDFTFAFQQCKTDQSRNELIDDLAASLKQITMNKDDSEAIDHLKKELKNTKTNQGLDEIIDIVEQSFNKNINDTFNRASEKGAMKENLGHALVRGKEKVGRYFVSRKIENSDRKGVVKYLSSQHSIEFKSLELSAAADWELIALGTSREEVKYILKEYAKDPRVRESFVAEIYDTLIGKSDAQFSTLANDQEWRNIPDLNVESKKQYCARENVYRDYVDLWFRSDVHMGRAAILLFAMHRKINIFLWRQEGTRNHITLDASYMHDENRETVHLLSANNFSIGAAIVPDTAEDKNNLIQRQDMVDKQKLNLELSKNDSNPSIKTYGNALDHFNENQNRHYQKSIDIDNNAQMIIVEGRLKQLEEELHKLIEESVTYSDFFASLFEKLGNISKIGRLVKQRTFQKFALIEDRYNILYKRSSLDLDDKISRLSPELRRELYETKDDKNLKQHLVECIDDLKKEMAEKNSIFFMWSIQQIKYHVNKYYNLDADILTLINELSIYYDITIHYWNEFSDLHSISMKQWLNELSTLITECQLYDILTIKYKDNIDSVTDQKDKLSTLMEVKNPAENNMIFFDSSKSLRDTLLLQDVASLSNLGNELIRYIYESLYHIDIFQSSDQKMYRWILMLRSLTHLVKFTALQDINNPIHHVTELLTILSRKIYILRDQNSLHVDLTIADIVSFIYKQARILNICPYDQEIDFRRSIFNHHTTHKLEHLRSELNVADDTLEDEITLCFASLVHQGDFYLPRYKESTDAIVSAQDKVVERFTQVKENMAALKFVKAQARVTKEEDKLEPYQNLQNSSRKSKIANVLAQAEVFAQSLDKMIKTVNYHSSSSNALKDFYDTVIIALLQGLPRGIELRETYESIVVPTFDDDKQPVPKLKQMHDTYNSPTLGKKSPSLSSAEERHHEQDKYISSLAMEHFIKALPEGIQKYFGDKSLNDPLHLFKEIIKELDLNISIPTPTGDKKFELIHRLQAVFLRHFILKNMVKTFAVALDSADHFSNEYIHFISCLLGSINFSLEMSLYDSRASINKLAAAQERFVRTHCLMPSDATAVEFTINRTATLLGLKNDSVTIGLITELKAYTGRDGQLAENLWGALFVPKNEIAVSLDRVALIDFMKRCVFLPKDILLNLLTHEGLLAPGLLNNSSPIHVEITEALKKVCLPLYTCDHEGQTLLHRSIEKNRSLIARFLIAQGLSVFYCNKNGESSPDYLLQFLEEELPIQTPSSPQNSDSNKNSTHSNTPSIDFNRAASPSGDSSSGRSVEEMQVSASPTTVGRGRYKVTDPIVSEIVLGVMQMMRDTKLENVLYISGVHGRVKNYENMREDAWSQLLRFFRSENTLDDRVQTIEQIRELIIMAQLKGFDAIFLREKVKAIAKNLSDGSSLKKSLLAFCATYENSLIEVRGARGTREAEPILPNEVQSRTANAGPVQENRATPAVVPPQIVEAPVPVPVPVPVHAPVQALQQQIQNERAAREAAEQRGQRDQQEREAAQRREQEANRRIKELEQRFALSEQQQNNRNVINFIQDVNANSGNIPDTNAAPINTVFTAFSPANGNANNSNNGIIQSAASNQALQGLAYQQIDADGHCLFHAVGLYLSQTPQFLRQIVAAHLRANIAHFEPYYNQELNRTFNQHIADIRDDREWGGHIEIEVMQRLTDSPIIIIRPDANPTIPDNLAQYNNPPIFIYYNGHMHYDVFRIEAGNDARVILTRIQNEIAQGIIVSYRPDVAQPNITFNN